MTNEQAKQKAIQDAYGDLFEKCKPDLSGWCLYSRVRPGEYNNLIEMKENGGDPIWRPLCLRRIEYNNGWNRIESVYDLPKESEEDEKLYRAGSFKSNGEFEIIPREYTLFRMKKSYSAGLITHYQQIIITVPVY